MSKFAMRLLAACVLVSVLLALGASGPARTPEVGAGIDVALQGDADCNGRVTADDAIEILQQPASLGSPQCSDLADVNCDGARNGLDAIWVLGYLAGIERGPVAGCVAIGSDVNAQPTSESLIDDALTDGAITEGEAILYKTYAAFSDPRLPAAYAGRGADPEPPIGLTVRPDGIAPEIETILNTFLLPPSAPGSWYATAHGLGTSGIQGDPPDPGAPPQGSWSPIPSPGGNVTVWWDEFLPGDQERAQLIAGEIDAIWDRLHGLLGVMPPSDMGQVDGKDATYDIYLVSLRPTLFGVTNPWGSFRHFQQPCPAAPTFILVNNNLSGDDIKSNIAHELTHAFQRSVAYEDRCINGTWLLEAVATWAEDFIYPDLNLEHRNDEFFENFLLPMPDWGRAGYDAYLFLLYLSRTFGDGIIGDIFEDAATMSTKDSIVANVPGVFAQRFHEFALQGWNQGAYTSFQEWDGITRTPAAEKVNLFLPQQQMFESLSLQQTLPGLAVNYLDLSVIDANVQWLTVNWPFVPFDTDDVRITVMTRSAGEWRAHELPENGSLTFCRDHDPVNRIVIVMSNADTRPLKEASHKPGNLLTTYHSSCGYIGGTHMLGAGDPRTLEAFASNVVLVPAENPDDPDDPYFVAISGTLSYTDRVEDDSGCTSEGGRTLPIEPGDLSIEVNFGQATVYFGRGSTDFEYPFTISCPDMDPIISMREPQDWVVISGQTQDLDTLEGAYGPGFYQYDWSFRRGTLQPGGPAD